MFIVVKPYLKCSPENAVRPQDIGQVVASYRTEEQAYETVKASHQLIYVQVDHKGRLVRDPQPAYVSTRLN